MKPLETLFPPRASSYLDWSDKGASSFIRYAIGLIPIHASWLILGSLIAIPFTLLGLTVFQGSAWGQIQRAPDLCCPGGIDPGGRNRGPIRATWPVTGCV
jgi:hypothetical protein